MGLGFPGEDPIWFSSIELGRFFIMMFVKLQRILSLKNPSAEYLLISCFMFISTTVSNSWPLPIYSQESP